MTLLYLTDPRFLDHDTGRGHPERPARLGAVAQGIDAAGLREAIVPAEPRRATRDDLERVHPGAFVDAIERFCSAGGGAIDPDTHAGPGSFEAALLAAGAGLEAIDRLDRGEADAAFCAVRPPGHHATSTRAMGFCLFNNVAVCAAALAARGERVAIVDYDVHHGNGTQAVFWKRPDVLYVSFHEWPLYPGTGGLREVGEAAGHGTTINLPLPAGATGDVYRDAADRVVLPALADFGATWLLVSAGFDAHRADPLSGMGLSAGDFADLTGDLLGAVAPGRRILHLEGGYDLDSLALSCGAAMAVAAGERFRPEAPTSGGPGGDVVAGALKVRTVAADG
ncbi:MAG: histone deacetylase [Actinobacteria bacterium]|nr:histone deacetylase [Actinomycetota bacterium]